MENLQSPTAETFEQRKDEFLQIHFTPDDARNAKLKMIHRLNHNDKERRQPFSLLFRTDLKNEYYPQGTFRLVFEDSTEMDVFLVPVGVDPEGGVLYEAVFN